MPVHDWTRVTAGIFHHFHQTWIVNITNALNHGILPPDCYALTEQIAGGFGPDVLTLSHPSKDAEAAAVTEGGIALQVRPPQAKYHDRAEVDQYASKASVVTVRHTGGDEVIAMLEVVSPGNKSGRRAVLDFVTKAEEMIRGGVHLVVVDLFPPGRLDPKGLQSLIWDEFGSEKKLDLGADRQLTLGSFVAGPTPEVYIEPTGIGAILTDMPLFLATARYVPVPLEATYGAAWEAVPSIWRDAIIGTSGPR